MDLNNFEKHNKNFKLVKLADTEGSRLMQISLLPFFKNFYKFGLCEFMPYALGYFISLVQFFNYFCPI